MNPNAYILSQEHITIVGGTQSGKSNHLIYYLKAKKAQGNRVIMITAKPELKYRQAFDVVTTDSDEALESFLVIPKNDEGKSLGPRMTLFELDITQGDEVSSMLDNITLYLQQESNAGRSSNLTVAVDEYSLLVKHKLEGSPINISLQRAAATWRAYGGQLITVAQRSSMISHTVLTQSGYLTLYRVPAGDITSIDKIAYPSLEEADALTFLTDNQYGFILVKGFDLHRYDPIPLQGGE